MPDCRNTRRLAVTGQASVVSLLTEDSEDGTLLDLSRKGARLRINHLFQRGQKLTLMLNLPWEEPPVQVRLAAVKWVQQDTADEPNTLWATFFSSCINVLSRKYVHGKARSIRQGLRYGISC